MCVVFPQHYSLLTRLRFRAGLTGYVVVFMHIYVLPGVVNLGRMYLCVENHMSADPSVSCSSPYYATIAILSTCSVFTVVVGLFVTQKRMMNDLCVYSKRLAVERFTQSMEIGYMLRFDDQWWHRCAFVLASFNHAGVWFRTHVIVLKLAIAVLYVGLRQMEKIQVRKHTVVMRNHPLW